MGVIYKLKDEIVDCILRQKKENPQISCRKLVAVIEETFRVSVSKSSVNTVIKEAHLSSPVGRAPSDKTRGFKIPHEKKVQLFGGPKPAAEAPLKTDSIQAPPKPKVRFAQEKPGVAPPPTLIAPVPVVPPSPVLMDPLPAKEDVKLPASVLNENVAPAPDANISEDPPEDAKVSLLPDPVARLSDAQAPAEPTENSQSMLQEPQKDAGEEYHYEVSSVGPALLRAALWDLTRGPALESFLKKHTSLTGEEIRILDVLLCLPPLVWEDAAVALDPENLWIWPMSGFSGAPSRDALRQLLERARQVRVASFDYFLELSYFFSMVDRVKIILRDRSEIYLDGRLLFLNNDPRQRFLPCPVDKSVENVIGYLSGDGPIFVYGCSSERFVDDLKNLIACCQNAAPKQIERVVLCDKKHEQFLEFAHAPEQQRGFVLFARMPRAQLEALVRAPLAFDPKNVITWQNQDCVWAEFSAALPLHDDKVSFNVVALPVSGAGKVDKAAEEVEVVFTNFTIDKTFLSRCLGNNGAKISQPIDIETVKSFYKLQEDAFSRLIDLPSTEQNAGIGKEKVNNESELSLVEGFRYLAAEIKNYASFLCLAPGNGDDFFVSISKLKGSAMINDREIRLSVGIDAGASPDLEKSINFLNNLHMRDYNKRVLRLHIK